MRFASQLVFDFRLTFDAAIAGGYCNWGNSANFINTIGLFAWSSGELLASHRCVSQEPIQHSQGDLDAEGVVAPVNHCSLVSTTECRSLPGSSVIGVSLATIGGGGHGIPFGHLFGQSAVVRRVYWGVVACPRKLTHSF